MITILKFLNKQAEEDAIFLQQQSDLDGKQQFSTRIEGHISQVLMVCLRNICL
jgi:hypothetical protein